MSHKRKNRSITLPILQNNQENDPFAHYLGENVSHITSPIEMFIKNNPKELTETNIGSYSTCSSDLEGLYDLNTKLSLSSSSSVSWSEDYELEITKKVQLELEKLHRAFQDVEDVPPPHSKDDIKEWKLLFPNLSILDQRTPDISESSSESDDDSPILNHNSENHQNLVSNNIHDSVNKSTLGYTKQIEQTMNMKNITRNYHTLPHKNKSFNIEKYIKISPIKSPNIIKKIDYSHLTISKQKLDEFSGDCLPHFTSLPYITASSVKTQARKPPKKPTKFLSLPPITNDFRSISAKSRQASSKSLFVSLNFQKDSSATATQMRLKSDLMKLFDYIPISNR